MAPRAALKRAADRFSPLPPLTQSERDRGWISFICPEHGRIVKTVRTALVICGCRKRTKRSEV